MRGALEGSTAHQLFQAGKQARLGSSPPQRGGPELCHLGGEARSETAVAFVAEVGGVGCLALVDSGASHSFVARTWVERALAKAATLSVRSSHHVTVLADGSQCSGTRRFKAEICIDTLRLPVSLVGNTADVL